MIYFEQLHKLTPGTTIYSHMGWSDGMIPCTFAEWQVKEVHPNSVVITNPNAVWGADMTILRRHSPLTHWSLSKIVQPAHITQIGKFDEELYADPWCLIGEDFWASASDDPSHPQGVWGYERINNWDNYSHADMVPCFWDDLPLTLQKFLVEHFKPQLPENTDVRYTEPHYTIRVMVLEVNEWGETLETSSQEGWHFVTNNLEQAKKTARNLAYAADVYAAHIPESNIFPLAPNKKGE